VLFFDPGIFFPEFAQLTAEIESRIEKERAENGIPLEDDVVQELRDIGAQYRLNFPD
jgi:LDH2 family malate/lactate/ureidoglycolate dehydrogenase